MLHYSPDNWYRSCQATTHQWPQSFCLLLLLAGRAQPQAGLRQCHHRLTLKCWPGMVTTLGEKSGVPASLVSGGRRGRCPADHRPLPVSEGTTAWWAAQVSSMFSKQNVQDPQRSHHIPLPQLPSSHYSWTSLELLGYGPLLSNSKVFLFTWLLPVRSYIK